MTHVEIFHSVEQLPLDVRLLMAEHARDCMQFGVPWYENLERTVFVNHPGLSYFVLRGDDRPMAVLPVVSDPRTGGRDVRALGNFYTALYAPTLVSGIAPIDLMPLINAIRRCYAPMRSLTLAPMDPEGPGYKTLRAALQMGGMSCFTYFCFGNWYLTGRQDWPEYLAGREGKVRSTVKRMTQRLASNGGSVEIITEPAAVKRGLAAYQAVYAKSWKVAEPFPDFMPGLMQICAEQGMLRLGVAWLHDVPIAAQLWIVSNHRAEIYKLAYDEAFKQHSPGTVLTAKLMQHAFEVDKVTEVDYLIGDDPYKKQWMPLRRERWGLVAYNLRSVSGMAAFVREGAGRIVKRLLVPLRSWMARADADRPVHE